MDVLYVIHVNGVHIHLKMLTLKFIEKLGF